ncbi:putative DP protein [Oryza sativa Japonica Group]|uniref:DP protein n=2 Tax=Oryza sativa subsp. japonica TaxID=39947 RepID=A0A9K3Y8D1_ORYSJ|nr:transcription factor-like protein DPB isoform X1 [Oryza sativa Japonica Group]AAO72649.1 DP protein [Oryza sativa Japonica Group]BAD73471.1 putative DP protein [Oryza sativa Japonica Group]BAF05774.1 Os01g0678700 [Oryza sativa Japonica Group]BAS73680.1 Os01g0678700 [Oryza sativa Japonica Group]|eukprot:NP_001043860.1 Os01g0678700 [Oryza sativa Japonica Group]
MAPPCGDAAAAASAAPGLANLLIREGAGLPSRPERYPPFRPCTSDSFAPISREGDDIPPQKKSVSLRSGGGGNAAEREEGGANRNGKKEKTGAQRITGWGLREFSKIVSKKVEAKGRTTYNEVADEIFAELKSITQNGLEFDEKNIRRRVYDAFNVLIAIRVIAKDKKEIKWMGLTNYRYEKIQKLEEVHKELITRIKNKKKLLQEIEKQFDDLQNITLRNQASQRPAESVNGILLPFLLIKTSRKARVEIEISEDSKFARFDFNGAPFTMHDDVSILEAIRRNKGRAGLSIHP